MFKHFNCEEERKCYKIVLENTKKLPKAKELLIYPSILMQYHKAYNYHNLNYPFCVIIK